MSLCARWGKILERKKSGSLHLGKCVFFFFLPLRALRKTQYSGNEEQEMLEWVTEEVAETPFLESFKNRTAIWDDLDMVLTEERGWDRE